MGYSKIEVDYMYKLLRFIYTNYRLNQSVDDYTKYIWERKYLYYFEVYNSYKFKYIFTCFIK